MQYIFTYTAEVKVYWIIERLQLDLETFLRFNIPVCNNNCFIMGSWAIL